MVDPLGLFRLPLHVKIDSCRCPNTLRSILHFTILSASVSAHISQRVELNQICIVLLMLF